MSTLALFNDLLLSNVLYEEAAWQTIACYRNTDSGLLLDIHIAPFLSLGKKTQTCCRNDSFIPMTVHPKIISNVKHVSVFMHTHTFTANLTW